MRGLTVMSEPAVGIKIAMISSALALTNPRRANVRSRSIAETELPDVLKARGSAERSDLVLTPSVVVSRLEQPR